MIIDHAKIYKHELFGNKILPALIKKYKKVDCVPAIMPGTKQLVFGFDCPQRKCGRTNYHKREDDLVAWHDRCSYCHHDVVVVYNK